MRPNETRTDPTWLAPTRPDQTSLDQTRPDRSPTRAWHHKSAASWFASSSQGLVTSNKLSVCGCLINMPDLLHWYASQVRARAQSNSLSFRLPSLNGLSVRLSHNRLDCDVKHQFWSPWICQANQITLNGFCQSVIGALELKLVYLRNH